MASRKDDKIPAFIRNMADMLGFHSAQRQDPKLPGHLARLMSAYAAHPPVIRASDDKGYRNAAQSPVMPLPGKTPKRG